MRTPNTFQIGSTTYTTREYCNARGITDNARILKIQWRINTYIRNHTIQQTIEELDRLTLQPTHSKRVTQPGAGRLDEQRQEGIRPWLEGIRPWLGAKQERIKAQQENKAREAATSKMITQQQNGETATKATDQRELLKQSEWMEKEQKLKAIYEAGDIENAIHQLAQVLRNATRLKKELESNQELIEYWKGITANLLNAETSDERTKRYNRPEKDWPDV
jgi:hypothetical protein